MTPPPESTTVPEIEDVAVPCPNAGALASASKQRATVDLIRLRFMSGSLSVR
jgi:hypothetical protein